MASSSSSVSDLLQRVLQKFGQRLRAKVPLELKHCNAFIDEPRIIAMAKVEKKKAWQAFIQKLFDLEDPEEDAVADCVREFGTTTRGLIDECVTKHKALKAKAEMVVAKYIEECCRKVNASIEEIRLENPGLGLDLKGFLKTEKSLAFSAFQHEWVCGNQQFYFEQKGKLKKKLGQLENELVEKQRNATSGPTESEKVAKNVVENSDDGSELQSDSMIVNTSASFNHVNDPLDGDDDETGNEDEDSADRRQQNAAHVAMTSSKGKRQTRQNGIQSKVMTEIQSRSGDRKLLKRGRGRRQNQNSLETPISIEIEDVGVGTPSKQSKMLRGRRNAMSMGMPVKEMGETGNESGESSSAKDKGWEK